MWSVLGVVGVLAACGAMLTIGLRMEPHWASKDGTRFTCRVQRLDPTGTPLGAWREVRAEIDGSTVRLVPRGLRGRELRGSYRVSGRSDHPPKGRAIFFCDGPTSMLLRIPTSSRTLPLLDALATAR